MLLTMSINTENSEGFLLRDISIFKNTVGSHRHLILATATTSASGHSCTHGHSCTLGHSCTRARLLRPCRTQKASLGPSEPESFLPTEKSPASSCFVRQQLF